MPDSRTPEPGGWNRLHFIVDDIAAEVERFRAAGLTFRNDIVNGPGGQQILLGPGRQPMSSSSLQGVEVDRGRTSAVLLRSEKRTARCRWPRSWSRQAAAAAAHPRLRRGLLHARGG